jgi:hypothetical protein
MKNLQYCLNRIPAYSRPFMSEYNSNLHNAESKQREKSACPIFIQTGTSLAAGDHAEHKSKGHYTAHISSVCRVCEESTQGQGTKNGPNCVALGAGNIKRGAHDQRQSSLGAAICFRMINFPMCAQQFDPFLRPCANNDKEFSPPAPHTSGGGWHGVSITCVCHWRLHSSANNTT